MNDIVVVGLSHKTAPVQLRERCAVDDLAQVLKELAPLAEESAVLNTCNRFEVYAHRVAEPDAIVRWLAGRAGVAVEEIEKVCYVRTGRNACKHLFFVSSSLDSLVVGETQIRGQVKNAYRTAADLGGVGPNLHRLFQSALRVSKEIAETTGVGRGNISVAGAAAELASRVFGRIENAGVLVIGAGETADLVVTHLLTRGVSRFRVLNRSPERAQALAERCQGTAGGLDEIPAALPEADVLICAAGAEDHALVEYPTLRAALRKRRGRPMVAIDIAVPRGIAPKADSLDNLYRYDMDTLEKVTRDALRHRRSDFIQCCTLIDSATLQLIAGTRAQRAGGAIAELERRYESVAERELRQLERKLPGLGEAERERVRRSVRRIVRKLLHMPVRALRESEPEIGDVIRRAFSAPKDKEGE